MTQKLTITVPGGRNGIILPEDVALALQNVPATLRSIDSNLWQVGAPRYRWEVETASKNSPFLIVLLAVLTNRDAAPVDVVGPFIEGIVQLQAGKASRPPHWSADDVERVVLLGKTAASGPVTLRSEDKAVAIDHAVTKTAERLVKLQAAPAPAIAAPKYGSVSGVLRQITVDQRERHSVSRFQIIDNNGTIVDCQFDPSRSKELQVTGRIVAYGDIATGPDGAPRRIRVDDFRKLSDKPPLLSDLHSLKINVTNGENAADYLDRMRDDVG